MGRGNCQSPNYQQARVPRADLKGNEGQEGFRERTLMDV